MDPGVGVEVAGEARVARLQAVDVVVGEMEERPGLPGAGGDARAAPAAPFLAAALVAVVEPRRARGIGPTAVERLAGADVVLVSGNGASEEGRHVAIRHKARAWRAESR